MSSISNDEVDKTTGEVIKDQSVVAEVLKHASESNGVDKKKTEWVKFDDEEPKSENISSLPISEIEVKLKLICILNQFRNWNQLDDLK